ncbi:hypothetical protein CNMCM5623_004150 [Aspergillus felis]|uniref:Apple domain-containing protein n=1 Tax=Aspergillus felis TaxID=1287682 RepID=A0A8H6QDK5_9EURO|nr:hypothetical protein CNMCM5623_004150 [Aspergillus felis]KAF7175089.1 hypothetical protein CNMCM7691_006493 [Aspergillus felis]
MSVSMLLFIILSVAAPVLLAETHQEAIYDAEPATSQAQTPLFAEADKCIAPYLDSQETYDACCPGFDQATVFSDGTRYAIHCHLLSELDPTPQHEFSDPASYARQCTGTPGCKGLHWDRSKRRVLQSKSPRTEKRPGDFVTMVRGQESLADKYEAEIEQNRLEARLYRRFTKILVRKIESCEDLLARAFGHRDRALNAVFQNALLDTRDAKYRMYFGMGFTVGIVVENSYPLEHHTFTSCLSACSRDDDCKATEYDPETNSCLLVTEWKNPENAVPDLFDGTRISTVLVGRKWEVVLASKARKVLEAIRRVLSTM